MCLLLGMSVICEQVSAQLSRRLVNVLVSPNCTDWKCKADEEVKFKVQVFKNENLLKDVVVDYELGPECYPTVVKKDVRLKSGGDGAEGEDGQAGIPALQSDGKGGRTMV